ncbi:MAG: sulfatase [Nitriliruptorales bacterium]|nr:sulfatase [Nitriliruptorales bacterium]
MPATGSGAALGAAAAIGLAVAASRREAVSRRDFLAAGAVGVGAMAFPGLRRAVAQAGPGERPNIVWFRSEDNTASFIGAYGNELANTPTIDRLAADGVLYRNFFTTSPVCAPTKLAWLTGMYEAGLGPGHNMRAVGKRPANAVGFATWLANAGYWCTTSGNTDYNTDIGDQHGYHDSSGDWQTAAANGQPFFALLGSSTSHETASFAPVPTATNPADVTLPAYHPDNPVLRLDRAAYMDKVTLMDAEVGNLLSQLESEGVADNTIVVYSSDHGGVLPRSKRFCYDSGLHAPLIIRFPERWQHLAPGPGGTVVDAPVSSVDAPPTVLALAGIAPPDHMQGQVFVGPGCVQRDYAFSNRNRMDESIDFVRTVRDERFRYIRNYMPHLPWGQHVQFMWLQAGVRSWEQAHIDGTLDEVQDRFWGEKPAEEFYDLDTDPDEVNNLIDAPEHQDRIVRMRAALDEHMLRINDNGFIPEGSEAEGYDQSRVPGAYPLQQLLALGGVAIQRDPDNLPVLLEALANDNEIVRYWGALGCSMLGPAAAGAGDALLDHMNDASEAPWVRIQCADALARSGDATAATPLLADVAADPAAPFPQRVQAVRSLTSMGSAALPALPQLSLAAVDSNEYVGNAGRYAVRVVTGTYVPAP